VGEAIRKRRQKLAGLAVSGYAKRVRFSPTPAKLALAVRDGTKKLDEALAEVKAARDAMNSEEWMIARLRNEAPDLDDKPR
jgi:hypothetical protein